MSVSDTVRYSPDLEAIKPNEQEIVSGLNDAFDVLSKRASNDYGHAVRSVHAKAHAILKGTMTVNEGLPEEPAQGLFSHPGRYEVYMRSRPMPATFSLTRSLCRAG